MDTTRPPLEVPFPVDIKDRLPTAIDNEMKWAIFVSECGTSLKEYTCRMHHLSEMMSSDRDTFWKIAVRVASHMENARRSEALLIDGVLFSLAAKLPLPLR